jgi:predicted HicB family RNase H-like nuclease
VDQATVHINLRLPRELHARLKEQAAHDGRSLNAEIVWLLDRSLTPPA